MKKKYTLYDWMAMRETQRIMRCDLWTAILSRKIPMLVLRKIFVTT
jgi:hypothetical protein